jgi:hypothetical protein
MDLTQGGLALLLDPPLLSTPAYTVALYLVRLDLS